MPDDKNKAQILYAQPAEDVVVVRVVGRGNFDLSPRLKQIFEAFDQPDWTPHFILDVAKCPSLDSTFMGVIAQMALRQLALQQDRLQVLNANPNTSTQLEKLGLGYLLDIREDSGRATVADEDFHNARSHSQSRVDRIVHMIESHRNLIEAHSQNEEEFRSVLNSLKASLEKEERK